MNFRQSIYLEIVFLGDFGQDIPAILVLARASVGNKWHTQIMVIPGGSNTKVWAGIEDAKVL